MEKKRIKIPYNKRIRWFVDNYYETGMEYEIVYESFKTEDLNAIKWYDEIIKIPEYFDELES